MLEAIFNQLRLEPAEMRTYLALLEHGASTAGHLSRKLGVPRSSLYGFLAKLADAGLVIQGERRGIKLWRAESPEKIRGIIERQKEGLDRCALGFEKILPELLAKQSTDYLTPRFSFFEGVEGVKSILRDVLLYRDIVTQLMWPARDMLDILGEAFMEQHNIARIRQNIYIQSIWPAPKVVDIGKNPYLGVGQDFKREIRRAPAEVDCSMGYWAYQNKVGFVSSRKECFGFIVESVELRAMLKTQFDVLWKISEPLRNPGTGTQEFLKKI